MDWCGGVIVMLKLECVVVFGLGLGIGRLCCFLELLVLLRFLIVWVENFGIEGGVMMKVGLMFLISVLGFCFMLVLIVFFLVILNILSYFISCVCVFVCSRMVCVLVLILK